MRPDKQKSPLSDYFYRNGLTALSASEKADIGYSHLVQIMNGKLSPGATTIGKLLDFGVPRSVIDDQLNYITKEREKN